MPLAWAVPMTVLQVLLGEDALDGDHLGPVLVDDGARCPSAIAREAPLDRRVAGRSATTPTCTSVAERSRRDIDHADAAAGQTGVDAETEGRARDATPPR